MSRTDFEAAYIERYGHRPRGWNDDFQVYQDAHANGAWFGWQARAAGIEAKAAPVGEREAFEAWAASVGYHTERDMFQRDRYQSSLTWELWRVWQAGAAYQRQQGEYGDAYQGAREDLAIWKRRAIEAEARVRQQDQIIDQMGEDLNAINGPTFMGEPVLPRQQAREVVMPKRKTAADFDFYIDSFAAEAAEIHNRVIDEFARLNGKEDRHEP